MWAIMTFDLGAASLQHPACTLASLL